MKHTIAFVLAAGLTIQLAAQPGVVSVHPANNPEGKILTMHETILSRELSPRLNGASRAQKPAPERAYSKDGSLWLRPAEGGEPVCIARSEADGIVYGTSVSRNEFGISKGIFWSPDSTMVAFYRKDETRVTKFPLLDIDSRTGTLREIRYPMAGMDSEEISLGVYEIASGKTIWIKPEEFGNDQYLTNISWSPDSRRIYIQILDRAQKHVHLNSYSAQDGTFICNVLNEESSDYVEPSDELRFVKGSNECFIYRTNNRDGYASLYLCYDDGTVTRLTTVDADVDYVANDGKYVYYTSSEISPVELHLFRVELKKKKGEYIPGKVTRLTFEEGWHNIRMDEDCLGFEDRYSSLNNPGVIEHVSADGKTREVLSRAEDPTRDYAYTEIDLGTVRSADGQYDNWYRMIKPLNFDPTKKYPVVIYVYGGPHSQLVKDTWLAGSGRWETYMAQRGYLVYVMDNRGTGRHGTAYEHCIYKQCGQNEMADQMEGVKMLMSLPYVDVERIGVHGWSYGGFMTTSLITNYPEIFKVAVAGGPVIDWKWYEVMYGERYMSTPQENPEGFAKTSLINKAKDLKGKLLICQGAIDNTVLWQHSLSFIQECIENNVPVDYFPYPMSEHNVYGEWRVHLMDKVSMYFEDYL